MTQNRHDLLLSPTQLAERLGHETIVVDCRFNLKKPELGRQQWEAGHIPGAFYADLDRDLASPVTPDSGRHPLPDPAAFAALLGSWGITRDTRVVAYDDAGGGIAARLWWLLRWAGHRHALLLDGGYPAWAAADLPVEIEQPELVSAVYPIAPGSMPVITAAKVQDALASRALTLLDARDGARFAGVSEPIDPIAGHIPGALNLPFQEYLDEGGRFKPADKLQAVLQQRLGNEAEALVACMCGSGVTACHIVFAMELAGLVPDQMDTPALYVGSWSEWIRSEERPLARDN